MGNFTDFLKRRLPLHEVSHFFPVAAMNDLFRAEVDRILASGNLDEGKRQDLLRLRSLNLVAYVDSAARRSLGIQDGAARDEIVHDALVYLLISPGSLIAKWDTQGGGPLTARLKTALKNLLINHATRQNRRTRRFGPLPDDIPARPCSDVGTINAFRDSLRRQFGDDHVRVLDFRLAGNQVRSLVGEGMSAHRLKGIIRDIKDFVWGWGDECLRRAVAGLRFQEEETLKKRFGRGKPASATK